MRFPRELFLNEEADVLWLRSTHVKHLDALPMFESFILFGNEDAPAKVELYAKRLPEYNDQPVMTLAQDENGDLQPLTGKETQ
jgi:hypothetical protein